MSLTDEPLYCGHGISNLRYCYACSEDELDDPKYCRDCGNPRDCVCGLEDDPHDHDGCSECIADGIGTAIP